MSVVEYLLVDGYNVIHAWPVLKKLKDTNLAHARDKLNDLLLEYMALSGERIIIVYDAHLVKNNQEHIEKLDGLEVVYTREGETADSVIEKLVGNLIKKGSVFVVTSDGDEQSLIFGRGAYRITPQELLGRIHQLKRESEDKFWFSLPSDGYLENRLGGDVRKIFEAWRRAK